VLVLNVVTELKVAHSATNQRPQYGGPTAALWLMGRLQHTLLYIDLSLQKSKYRSILICHNILQLENAASNYPIFSGTVASCQWQIWLIVPPLSLTHLTDLVHFTTLVTDSRPYSSVLSGHFRHWQAW